MVIRVGDKITRQEESPGKITPGREYEVIDTAKGRVKVQTDNGFLQWYGENGWVVAHTDWKEVVKYAVIYNIPGVNDAEVNLFPNKESADDWIVAAKRARFIIYATKRVTLPYKIEQAN